MLASHHMDHLRSFSWFSTRLGGILHRPMSELMIKFFLTGFTSQLCFYMIIFRMRGRNNWLQPWVSAKTLEKCMVLTIMSFPWAIVEFQAISLAVSNVYKTAPSFAPKLMRDLISRSLELANSAAPRTPWIIAAPNVHIYSISMPTTFQPFVNGLRFRSNRHGT